MVGAPKMATRDLIADHVIQDMANQGMPFASLGQCDALRRALDCFFDGDQGQQLLSNPQELSGHVMTAYRLSAPLVTQFDRDAAACLWLRLDDQDWSPAAIEEMKAIRDGERDFAPAVIFLAEVRRDVEAARSATIAEMLSTLTALEKWFDADPEILDALPEAERSDNARQLAKIRAAIAKARGGSMSVNLIGNCPDCADSVCDMNCSSALLVTGAEWIAASIWAGVFPAKATAQQVEAFRNQGAE